MALRLAIARRYRQKVQRNVAIQWMLAMNDDVCLMNYRGQARYGGKCCYENNRADNPGCTCGFYHAVYVNDFWYYESLEFGVAPC